MRPARLWKLWQSKPTAPIVSPVGQLRRVLGISSRYELDAFLKKRGVWLEYTLEDFRREGELTAPLLA